MVLVLMVLVLMVLVLMVLMVLVLMVLVPMVLLLCSQRSGGEHGVRRFSCPNQTSNDMATLLFNPQEAAIHQLFHQHGEARPGRCRCSVVSLSP